MSQLIDGMLARQIGTRGWLINCTPPSYIIAGQPRALVPGKATMRKILSTSWFSAALVYAFWEPALPWRKLPAAGAITLDPTVVSVYPLTSRDMNGPGVKSG